VEPWISPVDASAHSAYSIAIVEPKERTRFVMRCWKCNGPLRDETTLDPHSGLFVREFVCLGCGRRWCSGERPRPAIAA
ncbi:MAG TPA: hypothetical protein VL261_10635, partial [Nitrospira sp.]|nr:hypothetical protein [Nitrospira sp.]